MPPLFSVILHASAYRLSQLIFGVPNDPEALLFKVAIYCHLLVMVAPSLLLVLRSFAFVSKLGEVLM